MGKGSKSNLTTGLVVRIIMLCVVSLAVLTLLVLGFLEFRRLSEANESRSTEAAAAAASQAEFRRDFAQRLRLTSAVLANDPAISALLSGSIDPQTAAERLEGRRSTLDFRSVLVLDVEGVPVALAGARLSADGVVPLIAQAERDRQATAVVTEGDELLQAAAVAIVRGEFDLLGFVVVARAFDDRLLLQMENLSRADAAVVSRQGPALIASTLDRSQEDLLAELQSTDALERVLAGNVVTDRELTLGGRLYVATLAPLEDAEGRVSGTLVSLMPGSVSRGVYRQAQAVTLGGAVLGVLAALVLAPLIARKAQGPINEVSEASMAALRGDLSAVDRSRLPASLSALLGEAEEKQALETITSRALQNRSAAELAGVDESGEPERTRSVLLAVVLPRYARIRSDEDPREIIERLNRDVDRIRRTVTGHGGRLWPVLGHRALASFSEGSASGSGADGGSAGVNRAPEAAALAVAAELARTLSERENAFDEAYPPALALASGSIVHGGTGAGGSLVGLPVQQVEGLLSEAGSGEILLSKQVYKALDDELSRRGLEAQSFSGRLSPQPMYMIPTEAAAKNAGATGARGGGSGQGLGSLVPGAVVAERFELVKRLESAPEGPLFLAHDRDLGSAVHLRALRRELIRDLAELESFDGDLASLRRVSDPAVARLIDFGISDGIAYLVVEPAPGVTLRRTLQAGVAIPVAAGLRLARQVAQGLSVIHAAGLAHGDLRAERVVLLGRGDARLIDPALGTLFEPPGSEAGTDAIFGSPANLAPERIGGGRATFGSDIYAAGALLYEVFVGRPIYEGNSWTETVDKVLAGPPELNFEGEGLPEGLEGILRRCLARSPGERYAASTELVAALAAVGV